MSARPQALLLAALLIGLPGWTSAQTNSTAPIPAARPMTAAPAAPEPATDGDALAVIAAELPHAHGDATLLALASQAEAIGVRARAAEALANADGAALRRTLEPLLEHRRALRSPTERARIRALEAQEAISRRKAGQAAEIADRASDLYNAIAQTRRVDFSTQVLRRYASPLSPDYWSGLAAAGASDATRLGDLVWESGSAALAAPEPRALVLLAAGVALALLLAWPGLRLAESIVRRFTVGKGERVPLSVERLLIAVAEFGLPSLAVVTVRTAAAWGGLLSAKADALAGATIVAVVWAAAVLALGRALGVGQPAERRLLRITDREAARASFCLWLVALVTAGGYILVRLIFLSGASIASDMAAHGLLSLAYVMVGVTILASLRAQPAADGAEPAASASIRGAVSMLLAIALLATLSALLAGYATLAALISGQVFWLGLLAAATWLLLRVIDDLVGRLFSQGGWARSLLAGLFRLSHSAIGQIGVLSVAVLQLLILIGALSLALTPYGQSGDLLVSHLGQLGQPLRFGTATLSLSAIATGVGALVIGVTLARFVRDWVVRRYLPATTWDSGVRNSVSTGVGYIGVGIALVAALGAMGLGFQQIALIASALSVGIGFGLQQIVQNFVAGLILLVERPVKVGDWVNVDGLEGEISRIRVRATEIRMLDRTTVTVPNGDFVTKAVQNRSTGSPRGRLQLQFAIADQAELRRARELIETAAARLDQVLKTPPPAVFIDSLSPEGAVNLTCRVFTAAPREGEQVRTRLFQAVLEASAEAKLVISGPKSG